MRIKTEGKSAVLKARLFKLDWWKKVISNKSTVKLGYNELMEDDINIPYVFGDKTEQEFY